MSICEKLFYMMDKKGIKQLDLADSLGIRQNVISNWKNRKTDPPAKYLIPICDILDISLYELLEDEGNLCHFTNEEIKLIENYRKASAKDRAVVNMILSQEEAAGTDQDENHEPDAEP